jgi:folylpolyglutamate synthase/dihydropteroate synthase
MLMERLTRAGIAAEAVHVFATPEQAYGTARGMADEADRIIVFGSFLTVAAALGASA